LTSDEDEVLLFQFLLEILLRCIKLTTFIAMLLSVNTFLKGKNEVTIFYKTLAFSVIIKALAITVISTGVVLVGVSFLNLRKALLF
jgi:trk system potassium uptake protein